MVKPGFHMIVTIVAIATIVQILFDWTIATILTIHGFHMIVAIATVFMPECTKADDGHSVSTSAVTDSISLNSESIRSPFKIACYLFVLYENRKPLKICEFCLSRDYIKEQIFSFEVSSTPYPVIIFLYLIRLLMKTLRISR